MADRRIQWTAGRVVVSFAVDPDEGRVRLTSIEFDGDAVVESTTPAPPVEVGVVGEGRNWSARRYIDSTVGDRMRYLRHDSVDDEDERAFRLELLDEQTGLRAVLMLDQPRGSAGLRSRVQVINDGSRTVVLSWLASCVLAGVGGAGAADGADVLWAENDWLAEGRWHRAPARSLLPDINWPANDHDPRNVFACRSIGAWSTDGNLPVGVLTDPATGASIAWQVEHNGGWHWQLGNRGNDELYLSLLGPTDQEHQWTAVLEPGESFTSVPVSLAFGPQGVDDVFGALTDLRRAGRRPSQDHVDLPIIFNDYMNTLMGDPTTAKLIPLIDAAAEVGAEVFCIDAGWYDDTSGWWDSVGAWEPSTTRFPDGLDAVLDHIRGRGMRAGLWVEPEVIGVRSPMAQRLPDDAFFLRRGQRVVENGRFQLDFRHVEARKHLDAVVDRLVGEMGVTYFKFDYNINPGAGTDHDAPSVGVGLLQHNRAYLAWLDGVLDRHPTVTVENCASGGMRTDYALLSRAHLQSTSDQRDFRLYPPIAAAAAAAMAPEQAASWAYPQPSFSDDEIAFTMVTALLGRIHLSGHLDQMDERQRGLVAEALTAYRGHRAWIAGARPAWPLALPGWRDGWVSHALVDGPDALLAVWRRDTDDDHVVIDLQRLPDRWAVVYPAASDATLDLTIDDAGRPILRVGLPRRFQAVVLGGRGS